MKEHPIIFSGDMVRTILEGRKTQTRRPVKQYSVSSVRRVAGPFKGSKTSLWDFIFPDENDPSKDGNGHLVECPFGQVGDRLWVREVFALESLVETGQEPPFWDGRPIQYWNDGIPCSWESAEYWVQPHYKATDPTPQLMYEDSDGEPTVRWKPSIHMPRWASRITLEITEIRVERVQKITNDEARKEGIVDGGCLNCGYPEPCGCERPEPSPVDAFIDLWNSIYEKKCLGWQANPLVWVVGFKLIEAKGGQLEPLQPS